MLERLPSHPKLPRSIARVLVSRLSKPFPLWSARAWMLGSAQGRSGVELAWLSPSARFRCCLNACVGLTIQGLGKESFDSAVELLGRHKGRSLPWNSVSSMAQADNARELLAPGGLFEALGGEPMKHFDHLDSHLDRYSFNDRARRALSRAMSGIDLFAKWRPGFETEFCAQLGRALPQDQAAKAALISLWGAPGLRQSAPEIVRGVFGEQAFKDCCQSLRGMLSRKAESIGWRMSNSTVVAGAGSTHRPQPPASLEPEDAGAWLLRPLLNGMRQAQIDTVPLEAALSAQSQACLAQVFRLAFEGDPVAWRCAQENDYKALLGFSRWGLDPDLPGPDGLRAVDVAVKTGRALLFRSLLAIGADAATKGKGARKAPIERGKRLLRDDLAGNVMAEAERSMLEGALNEIPPPPPAPAPAAAKPRRL